MPAPTTAFLNLAEETLRFEFLAGAVTPVAYPHTAGWRRLPDLVTAHTTYTSRLLLEGSAPLRLRPGECLCMGSNVAHRIEVVRGSRGISRWSHTRFTILGSLDVFALLEPPPILHGKRAREIGDVNEELAEATRNGPTSLAEVARKKALGLRLLELVSEASRMREGPGAHLQGAQRLAPVFEHIERNLAKDLGRGELAGLVHLSPTRFYALFVQTLGLAPRAYVLQKRMQRAQQLLIGSELSVKEIAAQVGQPDPFHFSRIFKRECGASPKQYRIQARKGLA